MPIISNGGNATIAVAANQILTVQVSGGAEFQYENPVGTRLVDSGSNNVFGPFVTAGNVKLISVLGSVFYELATAPVTGAIGAQSASNVAITGGNISSTNVTNDTITGGTINNASIGGTTPAAGSFTTITSTGQNLAGNGSAAAPSYSFGADTSTGFYKLSPGSISYSSLGAFTFFLDQNGPVTTGSYRFGASATTPDLFLYRDAANTLAQRNSTAAQAARTYNSFTDSSNGSWGAIDFQTAPNVMRIRSQANGTGTISPIAIDAFSKAGAAVAGDIPVGTFGVVRDTVGLTTKLIYNNSGVLQSVALA